jgi:nitrogen-specific signal transduction histidine kinase/ActR/RegA family two-component response regulator
LLCYEGTVEDITERKRLEQQLLQSQKMEAIGRLAGGVAHDFNNVLTAIMGYSELLLRGTGSEESRRRNTEQIKKAAERAASLTSQLLAFSRRQVLTMRVLDLNDVVAVLEPMLRRLIGEDIALVTVPGRALERTKADVGQIEQVIMNLVVNARDAMPRGGTLTIETTNVELDQAYMDRHGLVPPGAYVKLAVSDTGCGMDAETQSHIFEPFFTTKEPGKGTGLGLSTVYGVIKQSGGYIWVYSEPGQGTTFKVYLPRVDEAVTAIAPHAVSAESPRGTETVLLVEDDEGVRELAGGALERSGYSVLMACGGEEALLLSGRHAGAIHLLVTDVVMPGIGGRELAERLVPLRPDMKVLYMSGYTDDAVVRYGVLVEEAAYLQKPFTPDVLLQRVRQMLGSSDSI